MIKSHHPNFMIFSDGIQFEIKSHSNESDKTWFVSTATNFSKSADVWLQKVMLDFAALQSPSLDISTNMKHFQPLCTTMVKAPLQENVFLQMR